MADRSPRSRPLRLALAANAAFSAGCGLFLFVDGAGLLATSGPAASAVMRGLGVMLIGFAALVAATALRPRPGVAAAIALLDVGWVAATLPLAAVPGLLTGEGRQAVVAVAMAVGAFAVAQLAGLRLMMRDGSAGGHAYRHCLRIRADAPAGAVWAVVADLGRIERFSPALARSGLRGGEAAGLGAVRDCADRRGSQWSEEVVAFDPAGRRLVLRFLADAPGFPFPVAAMTGGWRVEPDGAGSWVEVWWSFAPRGRFGWILLALMTLALDHSARGIVGRMAMAARGGPVGRPRRGPAWSYC
ncbi:MAG: SRPBCC family protein [Azospirillaceae bacterium]